MGKCTEIVHRVAAQSLRHGASCTRCMRPRKDCVCSVLFEAALAARFVRVVVVELVGGSKATCNYSAHTLAGR
jgi:DTW domain-containing protein YfiP